MTRFAVVVVVVVCGLLSHSFPHVFTHPLSRRAVTEDGEAQTRSAWGAATKAVLEKTLASRCSLVLLTDSAFIQHSLLQVLRDTWAVRLLLVGGKVTTPLLPKVLTEATKSRASRLLGWETRLLVVTALPTFEAHQLLQRHWTFSMMNTALLNLEPAAGRGTVLVHLPYTAGGPRVKSVAQWSATGDLTQPGDTLNLFPDKFSNFQGAKIPVTSGMMRPFWKVVNPRAVDSWHRYSGRECLILKCMARVLNFTFHMYESSGSLAAVQRNRVMMLVMRIVVIPQVLAAGDPSYFIERSSFSFSMAMPSIQPQWHSVYYPLGPWVWFSVLVSTTAVSCIVYLVRDVS
ncbi:hypothetical protein O3P69_020933 [Scylla paramamosain]|uniref:Uncharacterized protein n=1 Tax=Scylla paramamosain TaxID=85552 RepID=A0AAW0SGA5_SCYPA